jgi:hypothetical protein
MARKNITAEVAKVQQYVHGVAKHLVDRLYGPDGPAWGTKLSALEDVVVTIREMLSEDMLAQVLQRQAQAAAPRPQEYRHCPSCGKPIELDDEVEPRIVQTRGGEVEWSEPQAYCRSCRRSFFPSVEKFGA